MKFIVSDIKVSIIVPVYNAEKYIDRCLNSLINSTLKEIEIIIINDNTPDNSIKICEKYATKDNRIKIYNKNYNEGSGYARNYGIKKAKGEYIAFVDSDDYVDREFFEKLYNKAIKTGTDTCFGEFKKSTIKKNNIIIGKIPFKNDVENTENVLYNMLLNTKKEKNKRGYFERSVWQAIYKKSIIEENKILFVSEREYISEDLIFNFDYLMNSQKASFARGTYYHYCFNYSSLVHKAIQNRIEKAKMLKNILIEMSKKYGKLDFFYKAIMNIFLGEIRRAVKEEIDCNNSVKNIKKILNDNEIKIALKNKLNDNLKREVFNFFMKTKQVRALIIMHKIENKLKHGKYF